GDADGGQGVRLAVQPRRAVGSGGPQRGGDVPGEGGVRAGQDGDQDVAVAPREHGPGREGGAQACGAAGEPGTRPPDADRQGRGAARPAASSTPRWLRSTYGAAASTSRTRTARAAAAEPRGPATPATSTTSAVGSCAMQQCSTGRRPPASTSVTYADQAAAA